MRYIKILLIVVLLTQTAGCWDQNFLRNNSLAFMIAYDITDDSNKMHGATIIRRNKQIGGGQTQPENYEVEAIGEAPRQLRVEMNKITPGEYSTNKLSSILISEKLAKKNIASILDVFYRVSSNNLTANLFITKDSASDIIEMDHVKGVLVGKALKSLLESAQKTSLVPKSTLATVLPIMFDPGQDYVIPYIEKLKKDTIKITGISLFDENGYTGKKILGQDGVLLLLMQGKKGATAQFTFGNHPSYMTIAVLKTKHHLNVKMVHGEPVYYLNLKIDVRIDENTRGEVLNKDLPHLNNYLSKELTRLANKNMKTLQTANCDALGLGRALMIKYPDEFKASEWKQKYPKVKFIPHIEVKIMDKGVVK